MSRTLQKIIIGVVIVLCAVSVLGWRFLSAAGWFTGIPPSATTSLRCPVRKTSP